MDILNWIYLKTQNLIKPSFNNSDTDLIVLGAEVPFTTRGDGYQTYSMTVQDFKNGLLYNPTNQFFVDPNRTDDYVANGSIITPFKTILDAQTAINDLLAAGTIQAAELNPVFIRLQGSTTENVTLTKGHVYLVGENGSIHAPIYLTGTITVNGSDTSTSALDRNHFSIQGITVAPGGSNNGIVFTGSNAQRLSLENMWVQVGGTGTGILCNNTGVRVSDGAKSRCHGNTIKVSHNGSGDVYCFNIVAGTADFSLVETSGATQVAAVQTGANLAFAQSELDANGETCLEVYGTGILSVAQCTISNSFGSTACYGIWLHDVGSVANVGNSLFQVSSTNVNSRAVRGILGTALYYAYNAYYPGAYTDKVSAAIGAGLIPVDTAFTTV
jgi:hypothetical protein